MGCHRSMYEYRGQWMPSETDWMGGSLYIEERLNLMKMPRVGRSS